MRGDVGRHNAVDRVTRRPRPRRPPAGRAWSSAAGPASSSCKAVAAGVGSLVAVGAPTSLSVALATEAGLVLYGFASSDRCVRYA